MFLLYLIIRVFAFLLYLGFLIFAGSVMIAAVLLHALYLWLRGRENPPKNPRVPPARPRSERLFYSDRR